jgi:hypothetical protein
MTAASSSLRPSAVKTAPRPALNSGSSSITWIAACTASSAAPPLASTAEPAQRLRDRLPGLQCAVQRGARVALDHPGAAR